MNVFSLVVITLKKGKKDLVPPSHHKDAGNRSECQHDGYGTGRAAGEFDCGRAGHAGTAGVPAAHGTATVPRAPGVSGADTSMAGAAVGSAMVEVADLVYGRDG